MNPCSDCGFENIPGADHCQACGQSLTEEHLDPASEVERCLIEDRIAALDPKTPQIVSPEAPLREVLKTLVDHSIGCVLVVQDNHVTGIFSERDVLMRLGADAAEHLDSPVSQWMTPNPRTLKTSDLIAFALQRMDLGHYRHVPIVDEEGSPVGIISVRDILRYLTERGASLNDE